MKRPRAEEGFTLIELLIAMSVLGIISTTIALTFVTGVRSTIDAQSRFIESFDGQFMSIYFPVDASSATGVRKDVTTCAEAAGAGETSVVFFKWSEGGVAKAASYFTRTSSGVKQLMRRKCSAAATASELIMSENIPTTNPAISCTGTGTPCPGTGTGTTFTTVSIAMIETSGYSYTITGTRRSA